MRELYKRADDCPPALPAPIGIEGLRHELAQRDQIIAEQCRTQEVYEMMIDALEKQNEQLNRYIIQLRNESRQLVNAAREVNETVKVLCG